ncbi:hypothetical protein K439DRAFT_1343224 [Ramaria rubella]|nr:hypothetical protein K439DRAFT_1343224 [Ramaria rubella]
MTTFNSTFDWDSNLPPSISSIDENDFLLLLQKQFPSVNVPPIAPSTLTKGKADMPMNSLPADKYQIPTSTSPLSTDSSPSPPSANDDGGSPNGSDNNNKRAGSADEEHHKRKASADDFDDEINGQPSAKTQHTDLKSKKGQIRRKASGEKGQDESRLLKRKEQNRAAQRAFRERKEKHVKDLEDKVASLEAKTEIQATENENLRDLLSRLQNENVMLKQASFTFSVPSASANSPDQNRGSSRSTPDSVNLFVNGSSGAGPSRVPESAGSSVATASTHDSPSSIFEGFDRYSGLNVSNSDTSAAPSTTSTSNATTSASVPDLDTMTFFGSPGPFTTISSNPMFTSYRDPVQSMSAFASFGGGWDGDVNMTAAPSTNDNSSSGLEDLFGDQFSGLIPFSNDFLTGEAKNSPSSSSSGGPTVSPIGHHKPDSTSNSVHLHNECPKTKEDVERMIASGPKGTFGDSPLAANEEDAARPSTHVRHISAGNPYEDAFQEALNVKSQPVKSKYSGDVRFVH